MGDVNVNIIDIYYAEQLIGKVKDSINSLVEQVSAIDLSGLSVASSFGNSKSKISTHSTDIEEIYKKLHNMRVKLEESDAEIALLFSYLDGDFYDQEGYIDEELLENTIDEKGLEDKFGILEAAELYNEMYANSKFIEMWQTGEFIDENGNIDYSKLNDYLSENDRVTCANETTEMYEANQDFLDAFNSGSFTNEDGSWNQAAYNAYLANHPNVTCGESIRDAYETAYETEIKPTYEANQDFVEAYNSGQFLNSDYTWNQAAYEEYMAAHPNVTCGEQIRISHEQQYPYLTPEEYIAQTEQVATASYTWGVLDIFENIGDGLIWLGSAMAAGQEYSNAANSWDLDYQLGAEDRANAIMETGAELIAYDWTAAGYDYQMDLLGIREDIAYGLTHEVFSAAGQFTGSLLLSFVPGGPLVQGSIGLLSAAGSSTEQALQSGATIDEAYFVGLGAGTLGALSGYGLDVIGDAAKGADNLWQLAGYMGLGALDTALEPVGNSVLEYYTYGNDMVDSNGNQLYNNYWDYYVNSGAALNTVIAVGVGEFNIGINGINGMLDNIKRNNINADMDAKFEPGSYEGTSDARTQSWQDYFNSQYGPEGVELNTGQSGLATDGVIKKDINDMMDGLFTPGSYEGTNAGRTQSWQDYFNSQYGPEGVELNTGTTSLGYDTARNTAIEYYRTNKPSWMSTEAFDAKLAQADTMARQLSDEGVMSQRTFYEIWSMPKGQRPDPSTYLSSEYIREHLSQFENGAARLVDGDTYRAFVKETGIVGNPTQYSIGNEIYHSSEFVTTRAGIDEVIFRANGAPDFERSIVQDLGLTDWEYQKYKNTGIKRYDINGENLLFLNARIPSGNEPGAFIMDWIPGGLTLGGSPEIIIDRFKLDGITNIMTEIK